MGGGGGRTRRVDAPVGTSNAGTGVENGKEGGARGRHAAQQHPQVSGTRETEEEGRSPWGSTLLARLKGLNSVPFPGTPTSFLPTFPSIRVQ